MTRQKRHGEWFAGASGGRLAATIVGEGSRIALLLHGGGQTRHAWDRTALQLAQSGWTAITLDQRGHGESDHAVDARYSFEEFGADARAVGDEIAQRFGQRAVAIGASLGGIASLLALRSRPDVFAGLILVDVTPHMDATGVSHIVGFMSAHLEAGFATVEEAGDAVAAYLPHRPKPSSLEGLKRNLRQGEDGRWRWHWDPRFLTGPHPVSSNPLEEQARAIEASRSLKVPTLLVRGRSSELITEAAAQQFLELCPHAEYADIAGARHMVAGDVNDAFSHTILEFLNRRFPG
ncbi:alpha/beta hydrolase [Terrarubrum flagellatum]|uniref:alpha/beta fold hydrolase n=1 Tax=Terrirubrum flagellatum TaxID=2895980 RepID=UPI003144DD6E